MDEETTQDRDISELLKIQYSEMTEFEIGKVIEYKAEILASKMIESEKANLVKENTEILKEEREKLQARSDELFEQYVSIGIESVNEDGMYVYKGRGM